MSSKFTIEMTSDVGQGGQAKVYKVKKPYRFEYKLGDERRSTTRAVCKKYRITSGQWTDNRGVDVETSWLHEVMILKRLSHPRIVPYLDSELTTEALYLVMPEYSMDLGKYKEYSESGAFNVIQKLNTPPDIQDTEFLLCDVAAQLFEALAYLESQMVVHCDVKLSNILIDASDKSKSSPQLVLTDFGSALSLETPSDMEFVEIPRFGTKTMVTRLFAAPETIPPGQQSDDTFTDIGRAMMNAHRQKAKFDENSLSSKVDVFSAGMTLLYYYSSDDQDFVKYLKRNDLVLDPDQIKNLPEPFLKLLNRCVVNKAKNRWSASKISSRFNTLYETGLRQITNKKGKK